jgi:predicted DNA-binding transcriptional regulator AlpA
MKKKHPGGRPTDYKPEYARMAQLCIEDSGFSMYKLAKLFGVTRSTIYRWIEFEKEFSDGVKIGRKVWEGQKIHKSLVKRAVGFRYTETTSETDDSGVLKITKKVSKYYPPDVAAIKHWQSNMDPENWKDRQSFEIENKEPIPLDDFYKDADSKPEPS